MKKNLLLLLLLLLFSSAYTQQEEKLLFLKVKNSYALDLSYSKATRRAEYELLDFVKSYNVRAIDKVFKTKDENLDHTYLVKLERALDAKEVVDFEEMLNQYDFIEYIEFVPNYELFFTPNDPFYAQQWSLNTIQASDAWDLNQGSSNVVIAIVDDAVLTSHEDLSASIFVNSNETINGIDDDGNGYIDDVNGWDAANNDNNPNPPAFNVSASNFTHGTHVAGIAAAQTNNGIGIASIGFSCKILPVKIKLDNTQGPGLQASFLGLDYAIACGYTDVVNMSFGGSSFSNTFQNLINAGHNQGIVFVAAAGNSNTNVPMFPASYNHVISVGASTQQDTKASFSNYGATVDVMAPGVSIYSSIATATNAYTNFQGTSMASPLVAGLCGLMLSYQPNSSPDQIELCLKNSCEDISAQNPTFLNQLGAGRINAFTALQCLSPLPFTAFNSDIQELCPGQNVQFQDLSTGAPTSWLWQFPGGSPASSTLQNPVVSYPNTGVYNVSLTATNAFGSDAKTEVSFINVTVPSAIISGSASINNGASTFLRFDFTGQAPYSFTFTDGTNNTNITGINNNPYFYSISPSQTSTYTLTSMSSAFCAGTHAGLAVIQVDTITTPASCVSGFQKIIDDNGNTEHVSVVIDTDDTYFIAGVSTNNSAGGHDIFLNRYNASDQLIWSKILGTSANEFSQSVPMVIMDNGDLIVACESNQFGGTSILGNLNCFRIDINGNLIWKKRLDSNIGDSQAKNILKKGTDIIITGSSRGLSSGTGYDSYSIKLDGSGNTIWSRSFTGSGNDHSDGILELANGDLMMCGSTNTFGSNQAGMIYLLDQNGNSLWNKMYDASGFEQIKDARLLNDGNIICYGNTGNPSTFDLSLTKIDINGNIIFSKKLSGSGEERATEIMELNDGSFIISGYTNSFGHGMYDLFVSKLSPTGDEIWTKAYGGTQNDQCHPLDNNLFLAADESYFIMTGYTQSFGNTDRDAYIIKSSLAGDSLCNVIEGDFWNISNLNLSENQVNYASTALPVLVNSNFSISNNLINEDTLCTQICNNFESSCQDSLITNIICKGDTLNFQAAPGSNYFWSPNTDISDISSPNPSIYPSVSTRYIVEYLALDSCLRFDTLDIFVDTSQVLIEMPNDTSICANQSINLLASGSASYSWSPSGNLNVFNSAQVIHNGTVSEDLIVTGISSFQCETNDTISIEVLPCCGAVTSIGLADTTICISDSAVFINNSIYSTNPSFTWDFGVDAQPNNYTGINPLPVRFSSPGIKMVEVILVDDCGTDTAIIQVNVLDVPEAEAIDDTALCVIDSVVLDLGGPMNPDYQYLWNPSLGISDPDLANPLATITNTITYVLRVEDVFACVNFDTVNIEVLTANYAIDASSLNCGDSIILAVTPNSYDSLVWIGNFLADTLFLETNQDTLISLEVFDENCSFDLEYQLLDTFQITAANSSYDICEGDSIMLQASNGTNYTWMPNYNTSAQFDQQTLVWPDSTTVYYVTYTVNNCSLVDSFELSVNSYPQIEALSPIIANTAELVTLEVIGGIDWDWSPSLGLSCTTCQNPELIVNQNQTYVVSSENNGCIVFDTVQVILMDSIVECGAIPTAFSPNNDGRNDKFSLVGALGAKPMLNLKIYNRWGELLHDSPEPWDGSFKGELQCTCTYIYIMEYNCENQLKVVSGNVTLIR